MSVASFQLRCQVQSHDNVVNLIKAFGRNSEHMEDRTNTIPAEETMGNSWKNVDWYMTIDVNERYVNASIFLRMAPMKKY